MLHLNDDTHKLLPNSRWTAALSVLTSLIPWKNGSELDDTALAEGGVGGVLLHIPTVARKQAMHAGAA